MRKMIVMVVFAVVAMVSMTVLAQEAVVADDPATQEEAAVVDQESPAASEQVAPAEQKSARELLEQGLTVEKGGTANVNLNENVINVPEQPAPEVTVENSIKFPKVMKVTRTDRTWCERHPIGCTFLIVGVVGAAAGGGFYVADQLGAFDNTNTINAR